MKQKIFISYSHQDHVCAGGIARFLKRQNYEVWIDTDALLSGRNWTSDIDEALRTADVMLALLSKNSVRRNEVLREISEAFERRETDTDFQILFVVIGNVHPSWFVQSDRAQTDRIIAYLQNVQYVQLDARGTIRISKMQDILRALHAQMIYEEPADPQTGSDYVFEAGIPEKRYDQIAGNHFYRVHAGDLAPSAVFPFALDNQWLPDEVMAADSDLRESFLKSGFRSEAVQEHMEAFRRNSLYLSLIHTRQVILNRASVLNCRSLQRYYFKGCCTRQEQDAFCDLLRNGSIVIFLYGDHELTPYVEKLPKYATERQSVEAWNALCSRIPMYCIRENWENPIDKHRQAFAVQCTTLAFDTETNEMLAECFGFDDVQKNAFFTTLRELETKVFDQTHRTDAEGAAAADGYSRSDFYKNFLTADPTEENPDPVLYCVFDPAKPFHEELKKIIDVYYNSIFTNFFDCEALIPHNIRPEDTFIYQLYLKHGRKEVGPDELEYAFSEFFQNETILDKIREIGADFYLRNWSLEKIAACRNTIRWREYIELMEYITNRATNWEVDFSEVEELVSLFVESIRECASGNAGVSADDFIPAYTFRLCIGSKVLDIVRTGTAGMLKEYPGIFYAQSQNSLSVRFMIGDTITQKESMSDSVFPPIRIFDGRTNYTGGEAYVEEIRTFLTDRYGFIWMD